ncbi:MAG: UDP binding domain-containing protein [Deinococcales bacterium]
MSLVSNPEFLRQGRALRESLGIDIALELQARGVLVSAHDPVASKQATQKLPNIFVSEELEQVLSGADAAILVTEWQHYLNANWQALGALMQQRQLFDGRNALSREVLESAGFVLHQIGKL